MRPRIRQLLFLYGSLLALAAALACSTYVPIQRIAAEPARYNEQRVSVKGRVTQTYALPVLGQSVVRIDDGSGQIWVKPYGKVPFEGEKIEVTGTLKIGMTLANKNLGVIVYEESGRD